MASDVLRDSVAPSPSRTQEGETSDLACKSCKRRKAKCDRLLPRCTLCERNSQTCVYPSTRLKPGPKQGSQHRKRRRSSSGYVHRDPDQQNETAGDVITAAGLGTGFGATPVVGPQPPGDANSAWGQQFDFLSPGLTDREDGANHSDSSHISDTRFVRAISLSALVHPSHDANLTPPSSLPSPSHRGFFLQLAGAQNTLKQVCESLDLSIDCLQNLTDVYFDNMTALSLFHQPSFGDKIQGIKEPLHLKALLASMFSFSARFATVSEMRSSPPSSEPSGPSHSHLHQLSVRFVNQAIEEFDDEPPPLHILQALILCTFYELTNGVRGRAWRMLGNCVRIAYEQRLHLVDSIASKKPPLTASGMSKWSLLEERRRSWWAVWQMDAFASTVHKLPSAINQKLNETYLPVSDEKWFQNNYQPSCPLDPIPGERPKKLSRSGNRGHDAWFIVINSIMRDAQGLARGSLHSTLSDLATGDDFHPLKQYVHGSHRKKQSAEDDRQLSVLVGALQQTVVLLPRPLTYQGTQLEFGSQITASTGGRAQLVSERRSNAAQHAIFLMTQLARFMIYYHFAFSEILSGTIFAESGGSPSFGWTATTKDEKERLSNSEGLRNCLEASDDIHSIVSRCSETHVRWTSPFLASTVWLAASLQVLRKVFAPSTRDEKSDHKIGELRNVCQRYTDFWNTPQSLLNNLDSLEERLTRKKAEMAAMEAKHGPGCASQQHTGRHVTAATFDGETVLQSFGLARGLRQDQGTFSNSLPNSQPLNLRQDGVTPLSPINGHGTWLHGGENSANCDDITANCIGGLEVPEFNAADEFAGFPGGDPELSLIMSSFL